MEETLKYNANYQKEYRRTINGVANTIYFGQRSSSRVRNHPLPPYSNKEFKRWLYKQAEFKKLYNAWVQSEYKRDLKPSVGRVDHSKPYLIGNLKIETWRENYMEGRDRACRIPKSPTAIAKNEENEEVKLRSQVEGGVMNKPVVLLVWGAVNAIYGLWPSNLEFLIIGIIFMCTAIIIQEIRMKHK